MIEAAACHEGAARERPSEDCESASSTVMVHCAVCVSCVGLLPAGLYLPTNWYHYVRSEGRNIGVNFWYYLNPDFEGDCAESFDEPERLSLANCSWLGPGWDWQWNHETGIRPQVAPPSLPYSRYLPNSVAAPSPLIVAHSQVSYPRTSFPSPFCSTRFPFFVFLAAETVYSECAADDFPGRGNMRTPHGPYMSEAEPEPGLPARAPARARLPPARRLPALPSRAAVSRAPDGTGMSVLHAMCLLAAVASSHRVQPLCLAAMQDSDSEEAESIPAGEEQDDEWADFDVGAAQKAAYAAAARPDA